LQAAGAASDANFEIKGALANMDFRRGFELEVPIKKLAAQLIGTSNSPRWI
jgi:hypothetical protein